MRAMLVILVLMWTAGSALADPSETTDATVVTGKVTDLMGKPIAGARIHVLAGAERKTAETDRSGDYRIELDGDAVYSIVVSAGGQQRHARGMIQKGAHETFDVELEITSGEVVRILDSKPPKVMPKLTTDKRKALPYSAQAIERDVWAKAWLVLDVDETGKVGRVKLLKRPGFDLDEIAVQEALKLRFEPALDAQGQPTRLQMLWVMEWPPHGWLSYFTGGALRLPRDKRGLPLMLRNSSIFDRDVNPVELPSYDMVPCAGSGPLVLEQHYPVYRDCSRPELERAPALPWYSAGMRVLTLAEESAIVAQIDPALVRAAPSTEVKPHSHLPAIVSSTVTAGLIASTVFAYLKFDKYWSRSVDLDQFGGRSEPGTPTFEEVRANAAAYKKWQRRAFGLGALSVVSGLATSFFWFAYQPKSSFTVQPTGDGASATYLRTF